MNGSAYCHMCGQQTQPQAVMCVSCGASLSRAGTSGAASNRIAAGVCAIIFNCLGIHKFILGYTNAGLIMLLGSILTCGIAALPFSIIGIVEGIIYLTKSDEEFVATYVRNRKEWF